MKPEKSVLVFQPMHHPYDEALKSVRNMDFSGLRVDIFQALWDSREGSELHDPVEYFKTRTIDATSEHVQNRINAQLEKTLYMKKLTIDNNYDYVMYVADDAIVERDALQKLLSVEKDCVSSLVCVHDDNGDIISYSGRILDPDGPQDADDRPMVLHKDFEFGDIVPVTNLVTVCFILSRKVLEKESYQGFYERSLWTWLAQNNVQPYIHTGVQVKYLPSAL